MAVQQISTAQSVLKEVFAQEEVTKQFDEGTLLMDIIEKGDQNAPQMAEMLGEYDGTYVIFPLHTAGNPNVGVGVRETKEYPEEGAQTYAQAKYRCKYVTSVVGLTRQIMTRGRGNPQSIFNIAAKEASAVIANTKRRMNQWLHGDGSGLLANVVSYSNSAGGGTYTVDSSALVPVNAEIIVRKKEDGGWASGTTPDWTNTQGVYDPAFVSSKTATTLVLKKADHTTNFGTSGDNSTNAMGVYFWDAQGTVPYGIDNVCTAVNPPNAGFDSGNAVTATDDGGLLCTFGAIDRTNATNAFWKALNNTDDGITTNLAGSSVSIEEHIQPLIAAINQEDSTLIDEDAIIAVSQQGQWWQVVNALESGKRTEVRPRIVDGKYEVVRYGPITFAYDSQSTANTMKFFAPRYLFRMQASPWQVEDLSGSQYERVNGVHSRPTGKWRMTMFSEQQLCASYCGVNTKFTNIAS